MVRTDFEINARGSQRSISKLVLEIAHRHATIEAPYSKAMPKQMWMDTVPILARLVLVLDLLQASTGCYALEYILDLPRGYMVITVVLEQPAFRTAREQLLLWPQQLGAVRPQCVAS
jgi:hypothetical protein